MNLFSEIYNCYYQIIKSILEKKKTVSEAELRLYVSEMGYEESILYLIPKLMNGEWNLFRKDGDVLVSKITDSFFVPLTTLQKSFLKAVLADEKIRLFLDEHQLQELNQLFFDVQPLWKPNDFYYFDRFEDKDEFTSPAYIQNFQTLLAAIKSNRYVDILYHSRVGQRVHHHYLPCRLEYSVKNDKFRLLSLKNGNGYPVMEIINLERIQEVKLSDEFSEKQPDINAYIQRSYHQEPVCLIIKNQRNALERTMLQFANYEKNTTKIDEDTYQCLIYYNKKVETELLIEVLSFGPMVKVVGNEAFLKLLKERLKTQARLKFPSL